MRRNDETIILILIQNVTNMRKFYSFGFVMLLSLMLCGIAAVAQTVTVDNIVYGIRNDGTAQLQNGKSATGDVVIPAEV